MKARQSNPMDRILRYTLTKLTPHTKPLLIAYQEHLRRQNEYFSVEPSQIESLARELGLQVDEDARLKSLMLELGVSTSNQEFKALADACVLHQSLAGLEPSGWFLDAVKQDDKKADYILTAMGMREETTEIEEEVEPAVLMQFDDDRDKENRPPTNVRKQTPLREVEISKMKTMRSTVIKIPPVTRLLCKESPPRQPKKSTELVLGTPPAVKRPKLFNNV